MKGKTVLLPREWNDPGVPPEDEIDVAIKLEDDSVIIAYCYEGEWFPSGVPSWMYDDYYCEFNLDLKGKVIGWATILQQQ